MDAHLTSKLKIIISDCFASGQIDYGSLTATQWRKWLFRSENCNAVAIFSQNVAAWLQGQKKKCVKLRSDRKAPNDRKPPKEEIS